MDRSVAGSSVRFVMRIGTSESMTYYAAALTGVPSIPRAVLRLLRACASVCWKGLPVHMMNAKHDLVELSPVSPVSGLIE